jgi:hypothetical protein
MAEVRVRLPLGAHDFRVWESMVFRVLREHEIAGSNPAILTGARVALTNYCGGFRVGTGGRLLTALTQVRFLPPQLFCEKRKGKPTGDGSRLESGRASSLEGSTPSPSA